MDNSVKVNDSITAKLYNEILIGNVIGFGIHKGQSVIDLDNHRYVYRHQITHINGNAIKTN